MAVVSKIADILLRAKVVDDLQMRSALAHQQQWGSRLGKVIVEKRFAKEGAVVDAIARALNLPRVELSKVEKDSQAMAKLDVATAKEKAIFPCALKDGGKTLWLAMADPTDITVVDELASRTRCRIKQVVAGEYEILEAIDRHYLGQEPARRTGFDNAVDMEEDDGEEMRLTDIAGEAVDLAPVAKKTFNTPAPFVSPALSMQRPTPPPFAPPAAPMQPMGRSRSNSENALDDLLSPVSAPAGGWSTEELERLKVIHETQAKATSILRTLVDLCMEKGCFALDEYRAKLK